MTDQAIERAPLKVQAKAAEKAARKAAEKAACKAAEKAERKAAEKAERKAAEKAEAKAETKRQAKEVAQAEQRALAVAEAKRQAKGPCHKAAERAEGKEAAKIAPEVTVIPQPESEPKLASEPKTDELVVPVIQSLPTLSSQMWPDAGKKSQAGMYKRLARRYGQIINEVTALHDHHSLTPGRADWAQKWNKCTGKRILFFTITDYSGSFYKWAEAINRHTEHAVRMVSLFRHRYGYPLDILYLRGELLLERFPNILNDLLTLADEADIIHLKDQDGFWRGRNALPKTLLSQFRKPMVYTLYGGTSRKDEVDPAYQAYVRSHSAVVAMTPDLCFDWCESVFIPHNVDEDMLPFSWRDGKLMMHTPSTPTRKGTSLFKPAAERIAAEIGGRVEIITGTRHEYIMHNKPAATIFFDQAGREADENGGKLIGWYGNSALEAAAFGVPTMAHLSQEAIVRANRAGYGVERESAILNVDPSEEGIYRVMRAFFDMRPSEREQVARRTRAWIEKHHSYRSTATKLDKVYRSL